jgi:hypothetical protein
MNNVIPFERPKDAKVATVEISITTEILEDGSIWYKVDNGDWNKLDMGDEDELES